MSDFRRILGYEYLKIFRRKIMWVSLGIMMGLSVLMVCLSDLGLDSDGQTITQYIRENKHSEMQFEGKKVDDDFLEKYKEKEKPDGIRYLLSVLFNSDEIKSVTEEKLYAERQKMLNENTELHGLTEGERSYWEAQEEKLEVPFTYAYTAGERKLSAVFYTMVMLQIVFVAMVVSAIFADEQFRKMNQINLCCKYGKKKLYIAKITAGFTIALAGTICLVLASVLPILILYGFHGLNAQIQIIFPVCSYPLTIGQVLLAQLVMLLAAALLESAFAMFCAEKMKSSVGTMAVMVGILLLSAAVSIPEKFRIVSQIWTGIPSNAIAVWSFLDNRLIPLFGKYLTQMQVLPVVYVVIAAILTVAGYRSYKRFQVTK